MDMDTRDDDPFLAETFAERQRLATLLADLTAAQWGTDSLCRGWRVREVLAHTTMPFRLTPLRFAAGMLRAGLSFNRFADRAARADTRAMTDRELLDCLRENIRNPWRPPGGGAAGALSHEVIHGLDSTEPLGLPAAPAERIALVLRNAGPRQLRYFGVDLSGVRLVATDVDYAIGTGTPIRLAAKDILLTVTGRRPVASLRQAGSITAPEAPEDQPSSARP